MTWHTSEFQGCRTIVDLPVHSGAVLPLKGTFSSLQIVTWLSLQNPFVLSCPPSQRVPSGNSRSARNRPSCPFVRIHTCPLTSSLGKCKGWLCSEPCWWHFYLCQIHHCHPSLELCKPTTAHTPSYSPASAARPLG